MDVSQHFFFGTIFALVLLLFFPEIGFIGFILIVSSTVLIDVDHYLYYVYKKKDWSLKNAYRWYLQKIKKILAISRKQREKVNYGFFVIFHGFESLILLFFLSLFFNHFFYVFIGCSFHLLLDIIDQPRFQDSIDRVSITYDIWKSKKLIDIDKYNNS